MGNFMQEGDEKGMFSFMIIENKVQKIQQI